MIGEVDSALRALIEREAVGRGDVEVVFDAPTREWAARRNSPTIDVYLYDIREDMRRRDRGMINEYDADERRIVARHLRRGTSSSPTWSPPGPSVPRTSTGCCRRCSPPSCATTRCPEDLVTGSLAELGLAVPVTVALPPPEDRAFADVWSALGGGAQAVHRPGGQRTGGHQPALRDRTAGDRAARVSLGGSADAGHSTERARPASCAVQPTGDQVSMRRHRRTARKSS